MAKLAELKTQRRNANKHKPAGMGALRDSIGKWGVADGITVAADGESISGSARLETLAEIMPDVKIVEVETDGHTLLVNKRTDIPSADTPEAQALSAAVNLVARINYDPDAAILAQLAQEDDAIKRLIAQDDLSVKAIQEFETSTPDDFAEYDEDIDTEYQCPKCGYRWSGKVNLDAPK